MSGAGRGFSLVEVLVALVVGSLVAALAFGTVFQVHRVARERAERAGLETTLRNAILPLGREVASLGRDSLSADLGPVAGSSLVLRAARGTWWVCDIRWPDTLVAAEPGTGGWSLRAPVPTRDSLLLYAPGTGAAPGNRWLPLALVGGPLVGSCPGGAPAVRLVTSLDSAGAAAVGVVAPTVARIFESVGYRLYGSGATWQIGQEGLSAGATIQPIAGPVAPGGFSVAGFDRGWAPVSGAGSALIGIRVLGVSHWETAIGPGQARPVADSAAVVIPLRNAP